MLPSMYSPVESETFPPPDVCYSGEINHPAEWVPSVVSDLHDSSEKARSDNSNIDEEVVICQDIKNNCPENICTDNLEGAIGGVLPDLCVTSASSVFKSDLESIEATNLNSQTFEDSMENVIYDNNVDRYYEESTLEYEIDKENNELDKTSFVEDNLYENKTFNPISSDFLIHNCKHICLVSCGTGDVHQSHDLNNDIVKSSVCSESQLNICCNEFGALDELCDLQTYGLQLVRQNLLQSSDPFYYKWQCSAMIPSYLLSNFSLHSHGTSLGCDVRSSSYVGVSNSSHSRHSLSDSDHFSEEDQIKIAKRHGLITHLPCRVFDGSTKTRECVICMIDFSVGDKVRYLPCMHTYHTECIDDWLIRSFTCPSCLEPVDAALLSTYETS